MTTPKEAKKLTIEMLRAAGRPNGDELAQRYSKHPVRAFGLYASEMRQIAKDLGAEHLKDWGYQEARDYCDLMMREPFVEAKLLGIERLGKFKRRFPEDLIESLEIWLRDYSTDWWAVDTISPQLTAPLIGTYPHLLPRVLDWAESDVLWLRRGSVVGLIPHVRRGRWLDEGYAQAVRLQWDREDLIHKAVGWMLREAGTTDPERLKAFLLEQGEKTPRTSLRYAIERWPKDVRHEIMAATRKRK
ncbi:MAG: DNA alkylation repair protein [Armatimonadetes bacterium]|nr:DNA alkylation repair protein [Armatimonadota bacterium]